MSEVLLSLKQTSAITQCVVYHSLLMTHPSTENWEGLFTTQNHGSKNPERNHVKNHSYFKNPKQRKVPKTETGLCFYLFPLS